MKLIKKILPIRPITYTAPTLTNTGRIVTSQWQFTNNGGGAVVSPSYTAKAVHCNGTVSLTSDVLSGVSDSATGILSYWVKLPTDNSTFTAITNANADLYFDLSLADTRQINFQGGLYELAQTNNINVIDAIASVIPAGYLHALFAWDVGHAAGSRVFRYLINGVLQSIQLTDGGSNAFLVDLASGVFPFTILGYYTGVNKLNGDIADFYFAPGQFLDFTVVANVEKFIRNGRPVDLGSNGSTPTGSPPAVFLSGDASSFPVNRGTGGALTLTGSLTNASTSPST